MDPCDPAEGVRYNDVASPIAKSLNDVIRFAWMLVAVRWATMAGDQVGGLNLRTANAAVVAPAATWGAGRAWAWRPASGAGSPPARTSGAGNVRPTVQVSNPTPSFVTL